LYDGIVCDDLSEPDDQGAAIIHEMQNRVRNTEHRRRAADFGQGLGIAATLTPDDPIRHVHHAPLLTSENCAVNRH
jgi:hypothetical protein